MILGGKYMVIKKQYIGKYDGFDKPTHYYMIQNDSHYGIELVQDNSQVITSTYEWISDNEKQTLELIQLLCKHGASPIHLSEIIDNYIV